MNIENNIERKIYSIQEVSHLIEEKITTPDFKNIYLQGEIIQFTKHTSSGHIYLTLKDKTGTGISSPQKQASIRCVFFNFYNKQLNFFPKEGMEVQVKGSISMYFPRGEYNFNVVQMFNVGLGNLLIRIQKLKKELIDNGIINPHNKKPIPLLPKKIGIVTGLNTAAIRDIYKQIKERYSNINILISPAIMQGETSANSIVKAIKEISHPQYRCELILLTRGGGSVEDLMPFNQESVAMAIHHCSLPVVTGIGHHIDHPIADDVADLVAATPTDAAKQILPIVSDYMNGLNMVHKRIQIAIKNKIINYKQSLQNISNKPFYSNPTLLIKESYVYLDNLENRIKQHIHNIILKKMNLYNCLAPLDLFIEKIIHNKKYAFNTLQEKLESFAPLSTLKRGYALVTLNQKIIKSKDNLKKDDLIKINFFDSDIQAKII